VKTEIKNKESETKKLSCLFCASRCGMILYTHSGKVTRVEGDPENLVSRGWTCSRGRAAIVERYQSLLKIN